MKKLIILFVLSLFAFTNNTAAYAVIETAPPVEKTFKKKKHKKKRLFKKKSKRIKTQKEMKTSTLYSIVGLVFALGSLTLSITSLAIGWSVVLLMSFLILLALAILFIVLTFVELAKEKKEKSE